MAALLATCPRRWCDNLLSCCSPILSGIKFLCLIFKDQSADAHCPALVWEAQLLQTTGVFAGMRVYFANVSAKMRMAIVLGSVAFCGWVIASAHAETTVPDDNPYSVISDKNVFHLNPPPPPPAVAEKPPELPKVMLSGFQKVGKKMEVFLALPAKDPKDTAYLALQAGDKSRGIEIVAIRANKRKSISSTRARR